MDAAGPDARLASTPQVLAEIVRLFDLGRGTGGRDLGGSWSTNLLVESDARGRLVARIHRRSTSPDRVAAEQAARRVLAEAGVPAVVALAGPDGATVQRLRSGHLVELEPHVPSSSTMKTPQRLRLGFAQLARLHGVLRSAALPAAARQVPWANHLASAEAVEATRRGAERIRRWDDRDLGRFADAATRHVEEVVAAEQDHAVEQRIQVVHGDFWDDNVLFREYQVAAVLDFGFMAERTRVDDLALPFWFFLLEPGRRLPTPDDMALLGTLVQAYDQAAESPLSAAERASLPLAIARQPAWSVGGWVLRLGEADAVRHARDAAAELPVARWVLRHREAWQRALA